MTDRTFRFKLKIKGCTQTFHPDFEPGVLVVQEASWTGEQPNIHFYAYRFAQDLIDEYIEVEIEEIPTK